MDDVNLLIGKIMEKGIVNIDLFYGGDVVSLEILNRRKKRLEAHSKSFRMGRTSEAISFRDGFLILAQ